MNQTLGTAWACPYCAQEFVSPQAYRQHLEQKHAERPPAPLAEDTVTAFFAASIARHGSNNERRTP